MIVAHYVPAARRPERDGWSIRPQPKAHGAVNEFPQIEAFRHREAARRATEMCCFCRGSRYIYCTLFILSSSPTPPYTPSLCLETWRLIHTQCIIALLHIIATTMSQSTTPTRLLQGMTTTMTIITPATETMPSFHPVKIHRSLKSTILALPEQSLRPELRASA